MDETCPVCGEKMMNVSLFGRKWKECSVTVCMALDFKGTMSDGDDELKKKMEMHNEHDARTTKTEER